MASVHYFQRYSKEEDVVTNNTLLLLSRLFHYSPIAFEAALNEVLGDVNINIGPAFVQQKGSRRQGEGASVPDGTISQSSFSVMIETKLGRNYDIDQLVRHLNRFGEAEIQMLLHLSPYPPDPPFVERVSAEVRRFNEERKELRIQFKVTTFGAVVEAVRGVLPEHAYEMIELADDFAAFCSESGLVPTNQFKMRVVLCGDTIDENVRYGVYYHRASCGYSDLGYLGLYTAKSVRAVGKVRGVVVADVEGDAVRVVEERKGTAGPEDMENIRRAVRDGRELHGYTFDGNHIFFLVERFEWTDFAKSTKGPLIKERHFDLRDELGVKELPDVEEIAARLRERKWGKV